MRDRILYIASISPFEKGGGSQAVLCFLDSVLEVYGRNKVDVFTIEETVVPESYQDINFIKIKKRSILARFIGVPFGYIRRLTKPLMSYVKKYSNNYRICIINYGDVAGKAVPYINKQGIKSVVIHHNYEVQYHGDNKTIESFGGYFLGAIKRAERSAYKNADVNLFLTKQDEELFICHYGTQRHINGVIGTFDMKNSEKVKIEDAKKMYDIVIRGSLGDYQTVVGIKDYYNNYLAITNKLILNPQILLTGRNPAKDILDIVNNEASVFSMVSNPEKIMPVVQQGKIYLCPTCIGGGLKLRAMDGLKCGLPVLVHAVSARGYDYYFDKPYFKIYDSKDSFEKGLIDIIEYLKHTPNVSEQIHKDYYEYFGFEKGVERVRNFLTTI